MHIYLRFNPWRNERITWWRCASAQIGGAACVDTGVHTRVPCGEPYVAYLRKTAVYQAISYTLYTLYTRIYVYSGSTGGANPNGKTMLQAMKRHLDTQPCPGTCTLSPALAPGHSALPWALSPALAPGHSALPWTLSPALAPGHSALQSNGKSTMRRHNGVVAQFPVFPSFAWAKSADPCKYSGGYGFGLWRCIMPWTASC
eukprot:365208-Chlamydomonas_euryale.AAC.8